MTTILFEAGALMLAFAVWRLVRPTLFREPLILLYLIAATGSGLVTAAALVALAP